MSNIKEWLTKAVWLCQPLVWSMAAMLGNAAIVIVMGMRPRAIPLAIITMRKSTHGFPFLPIRVWGFAWRPEPELCYELSLMTLLSMSSRSSVDRAPTWCSRGHRFNSHPGLRFFLCPMLMSC